MSMNVPMIASLKFSDFIVNTVTGDLTDDHARTRARDNEGPSILWILGHLMHYRYLMMGLLGHQEESPYETQFTAGATDGSNYPPITDMVTNWNTLADKIAPVFESATDEMITAPMGGHGAHGEKKVLDNLAFFVWHEAYHMGQVGTLRTKLGLTPTAVLATQAQGE